jgi:hypothetical protein
VGATWVRCSAALLTGAFALCGPALAQADKTAAAEKARLEQMQAISKAVADWDRENVPRLFRLRALSGCGSNCPPNSGQELIELDRNLLASVSRLLDVIRSIPVVACDAAFAQRVQRLFDDKASDRKPLTVKVESKCAHDGKLLVSTISTIDKSPTTTTVDKSKNDDSVKRAGAEKARLEQMQAISKAVADWDRENVARLFRLRALSGCGSNCPPNSGQELIEIDRNLHGSATKLLDDIRSVPVVACDAAFAQRVQHLFDDKASDRKPLTVKVESKCSPDGKLLLSAITIIDTKSLQTIKNEKKP